MWRKRYGSMQSVDIGVQMIDISARLLGTKLLEILTSIDPIQTLSFKLHLYVRRITG